MARRTKSDKRIAMAIEQFADEQRSQRRSTRAQEAREARARNVGAQSPAKVRGDEGRIGRAANRTAGTVGRLARGASGVGALLSAEKLGGGKDTMEGRESRRDEFVKKADDVRRVKAATEARRKADKIKDEPKSESKPTGQAKDKPKSHSIKRGDTLSAIAKKYGTTVEALAKKNNIKDPDKIYAGKSLKLNKGGMANCGASVPPAQKSSKGNK